MNGDVLTGRCLCGGVRYRVGPRLYPPTLCHCESCRRAAGAHAVGWLTVARADFVLTAGELRELESSPGVHRAFCPRCGAPVTYRNARRAGEIDVTLGTLDEPSRAAPVDHIWMEDAPAWDRPGDGLPQYPRGRDP
ncbi:MAG: GFA family protein [Proteobacteria bacterium]|nr:GFA family protein [Pseudomonadota bacterium]